MDNKRRSGGRRVRAPNTDRQTKRWLTRVGPSVAVPRGGASVHSEHYQTPVHECHIAGLLHEQRRDHRFWPLKGIALSVRYRITRSDCRVSDALVAHCSVHESDGPVISGGRALYQVGDVINLTCTSNAVPAPQLKFYINDKEVIDIIAWLTDRLMIFVLAFRRKRNIWSDIRPEIWETAMKCRHWVWWWKWARHTWPAILPSAGQASAPKRANKYGSNAPLLWRKWSTLPAERQLSEAVSRALVCTSQKTKRVLLSGAPLVLRFYRLCISRSIFHYSIDF